jgi:hypothetical protein
MGELAQEKTMKTMRFRYKQAVDEEKQKLWEYKKNVKAQTQHPQVELLPMTIEPLGSPKR